MLYIGTYSDKHAVIAYTLCECLYQLDSSPGATAPRVSTRFDGCGRRLVTGVIIHGDNHAELIVNLLRFLHAHARPLCSGALDVKIVFLKVNAWVVSHHVEQQG